MKLLELMIKGLASDDLYLDIETLSKPENHPYTIELCNFYARANMQRILELELELYGCLDSDLRFINGGVINQLAELAEHIRRTARSLIAVRHPIPADLADYSIELYGEAAMIDDWIAVLRKRNERAD